MTCSGYIDMIVAITTKWRQGQWLKTGNWRKKLALQLKSLWHLTWIDVGLSFTSVKVTVITLSINKGGLPLSVLRIVKAYLHNVIVLVVKRKPAFTDFHIFPYFFTMCWGITRDNRVFCEFSINLEEIHNSLSLTVCSLSRSSEQQ